MVAPQFPESILSVDPGGSVGFAQLDGPPRKKSSYRAWIIKLGPWPLKGEGEPSKDAALAEIDAFCKTYTDRSLVICERFTTAQRGNRYSRFTMEMIGCVEGICYVYDTPLIMVMNRDRKDAMPQAYRMLGKVKKGDHDDDDCAALGHLLAFVAKLHRAIAEQNKK